MENSKIERKEIMKEYRLSISWQMTAYIVVEAESLDDAAELALELKLPSGQYLEGSLEVDIEESRENES